MYRCTHISNITIYIHRHDDNMHTHDMYTYTYIKQTLVEMRTLTISMTTMTTAFMHFSTGINYNIVPPFYTGFIYSLGPFQ